MTGMELVEFGSLTEEQRRELEGDEQDPWDAADWTLRWRPKERHVALRDDHGRLIASAGMVVVDVEVDGRRFPVVGLGGVIVEAGHRGRGHAREVVSAIITRAKELGPRFMMLFCHADRAGLYRKLGFTAVASDVTVEQPEGTVTIPMVAMWRGLKPGAVWPAGPVAVLGFPF
jgi:predicted N-acetyltransferase YhbS